MSTSKACIHGKQFSSDSWAEVKRLIREDLSAEQVPNRVEPEGELQISHEAFYWHIYADKHDGCDLCRHLRSQKRHRKRYTSGQERLRVIKNRVSIGGRPEIIDQKTI